jgi:hypothetical protein
MLTRSFCRIESTYPSSFCNFLFRPSALIRYFNRDRGEAGWLDLEAVTSRSFLVSAAARLQPASRAPERLMQEPRRGLPLRDPLVSFLSKARL